MKRLIDWALSRRLLVVVATLALIGAGIAAWRSLPIDAFPDVSSTQVKIILKAPGMTPEEVESRIVAPIELEMLGVPHQTIMRSQSKYAIADITVDFEEGTDVYWARQQVAERLANAQDNLPSGIAGGLAPITTPLGEMFMFTVDGPQSLAERRTLLDWVVRPQLRAIPGVADVNSLGGYVQTYEVKPDPVAMAARQVSFEQLQTAVESNNRNDGAGRVTAGEESLVVRTTGAVNSLQTLGDVVVGVRDHVPVRVRDVAAVQLGTLTRYGAVTQDGKAEAVEGLVLGLRGSNAREVVGIVRDKLAEIEAQLPPGTTLRPFYDRAELVDRAVNTVQHALGEAIVLVLVLLFAFLGNLRAAIVVAVILPLSALGTFVLMRQVGLSANLMSLGGLTIAIGMLVDAAVVVVENIEARAAMHDPAAAPPGHAGKAAHTSQAVHGGQPSTARRWLETVREAAGEVALPVASGIAIIIVVFVPLLSLQGLEGKMFGPVALTIVFALAASLLLSLTVIPALASVLIKPAHGEHLPWLVRALQRIYEPLLHFALRRPPVVIGAALVLLVGAGLAFMSLGKSFMPQLDEGDLLVQLEKVPSINLKRALETDMAFQKRVLESVPEVERIVGRAGSDELGLDPMGPNESDTFLVLKPREQWRDPDKEKITEAVRAIADDFVGINFNYTQPIEMRTSEMLSGVRADLAIKIFGSDLATLGDLATRITDIVRTVPGNQDVNTVRNAGVQYLVVEPDRTATGRFGLTIDQLSSVLKSAIEGQTVGVVLVDGRRLPLVIRSGAPDELTVEKLTQMRLPMPDGQSVPLTSVATVKMVDGPIRVDRENGTRYAVVRANVSGRDLVGFVDEARARIEAEVKLPPGVRITWGGQFENQQRAAARLMLVVPIALAFILLLLYLALGQLPQALLVISNIPFALVGGVFALLISGEYLSVPASVGFIALMGIAVLNGLVMITYFNQQLEAGVPLDEVVRGGAMRRLRPVMMTASIAAFGLVPLLVATGPGSEIQRPLAVVVIGGLISSTLLTLLVLPVLYRALMARQRRREREATAAGAPMIMNGVDR